MIWRTTLAEQHPDRQECTRRLAALVEKCAYADKTARGMVANTGNKAGP